ncbi:DUF5684 domain-containing protein [Microbacterium resistens]|uniref:DUF5684 domain-containing protein n=1 Tax=Microbacterium resistens TaxID=156977 RepID=UPI000834BB54|nr:DUF5684 domain-containing protein [Microbacterium resistens]
MPDLGLPPVALVAGAAVGVLVAAALFVWYAVALSRLFPRLGGEGWKGWVPVLNEAEILARGGVPAWSVVFFFIPLVQFYGLYLRIVAVHRITVRFRRGAGFTVLGVLLPPLWATLLARAEAPAAETAPPHDPAKPRTGGIRTLPDPRRTTLARDASGYAIPIPAPLEPTLIDDVPIERPGASASVPAAPEQDPDLDPAPAPAAPGPAPAPAVPDPARAPVVPDPAPVSWHLVLDDGTRLPLPGPRIVLGRAPAGTAGDQPLAVPDATRTVSKTHARLEHDGTRWHLTDLSSTNGSGVQDASGGWQALSGGERVVVDGAFRLGDLTLRLIRSA